MICRPLAPAPSASLLGLRIATLGLIPEGEAAGISARTARKWLRRFEQHDEHGLLDRSSRPLRTRSCLDARLCERIEQLRRSRMPMRHLARIVGRSVPTVCRLIARLGLSSLKALEPVSASLRYEREAPGELLHIDTKKLGRIALDFRRPNDLRMVL